MAGKSYDGYFEELKSFVKLNNLKKVILLKDVNYYIWFALLEGAIAGFALYGLSIQVTIIWVVLHKIK